MVLYHGSDHIIQKPEAKLGKTTNDYGRGFYCTEHVELAKEWACQKATDGFANRYEFDTSGLKVCNLGTEPYHILNWLALLTRYRSYWQADSIAEEAKDYLQEQFFIDLSDVDVIIGYRADDSYFSFAQDFISGTISLEQLSRAMRLGKLGEQIVIKSERAFERLIFQDAEVADAEEYYIKKITRDREARQAYRKDIKMHSKIEEILITDIMRGTVSIDELRI
ncbi:MAG: DUF3990 domain-containing protein [Lachnospiraceae bacterium]|nr:DUF3990 domain-containing protein [Lachnospiraceae bacterium]